MYRYMFFCFAVFSHGKSFDSSIKEPVMQQQQRSIRSYQRSHHDHNLGIVGGHEADIKDYPHQVFFYFFDTDGNRFSCGGFIISENYIVTAGHCTHNVRPEVLLHAGSSLHDGGITIPIAQVIPHPQYNPSILDNDVGVLKTVYPIQFTDVIKPIGLPQRNRPIIAGSELKLSGWGRLHENDLNGPVQLYAVKIPVVDRTHCSTAYGNQLTVNEFCGGNYQFGGQGSCQGDSGGAIVQEGLAVGIVSHAFGCGRPQVPSVFMNVAAPNIRDFIKEHTGL